MGERDEERLFIVVDLLDLTRKLASLEMAARIAQLDPAEILWAIEEFGVCETERYVIADCPDPESKVDPHSAPRL